MLRRTIPETVSRPCSKGILLLVVAVEKIPSPCIATDDLFGGCEELLIHGTCPFVGARRSACMVGACAAKLLPPNEAAMST